MRENIESLGRIVNQLNFVLDRQQKRGVIKVFLCMVIAAVLDLLGVSAIYPFLQMLLNPEALKNEWYTAWIYTLYPEMSNLLILLFIGISIILIYLVKNIAMIFIAYIQNAYAANFRCEMSTRMLGSYLKRPYQYFLNVNSSIILRGINSDVSGVYEILLNLFTMISEALTVFILGIFLLTTDWGIGLSAMLLAGLCFGLVVYIFKEKMKNAGKTAQEAISLKNQYGYQAINGIKEITVLDRKDKFLKYYNKAALLEKEAVTISGFIGACPDRILEGICVGGFMGIVCIRIAMGTDLALFVPTLGMFAMAAFRVLPSIAKISSRINSIIYFQPTLQNVYDNLKEVKEYELGLENADVLKEQEERSYRFKKQLKINNISWRYQNTQEDVLCHVSIEIKKGEAVAFIGSSGAGKSTLADIIMGLLRPQEGTVEMDGINIFAIPHLWSKIIGYVPQSVFLTDDTVRNNVAFGLEENEISDEKVWAALQEAQLGKFVETLPHGLDTIVGERGIRFSGGQRQRIAIARALYENPDILVLDEATSALDNETEMAVMESIDALQGSKTLIIVAHRLTTIKNCDRIYEIGDGVAIERRKEDILL